MARSRFVFLEGTCREVVDGFIRWQRADGTEAIYVYHGGEWIEESTLGKGRGIMVIPDIKPYTSMVTGEEIPSRSVHRAHLRQHGCEELGNEKIKPKQYNFKPPELRSDLLRAWDQQRRS